MNAAQRKSLSKIAEQLRELHGKIEDLKNTVESEKDDERGKFDNMPEGLQNGDRGQAIDESANQLFTRSIKMNQAVEQNKTLVKALSPALQWLETLIKTPAIAWNPGQKEAAEQALQEARASITTSVIEVRQSA